jgi:hypothetical protein
VMVGLPASLTPRTVRISKKTVGCVVQVSSSYSYGQFVAGRFIAGLGERGHGVVSIRQGRIDFSPKASYRCWCLIRSHPSL